MNVTSVLEKSFKDLAVSGHSLGNTKKNSIISYIHLFSKWNQRINLSAAKTITEIEHHVADCLYIVPHLAERPTVLDVGAGGGLPGLLVAIALPSSKVVSIEPVNKKHAFLRTAARELALENHLALAERIEDHQPGGYSAVISRATFDLATWLDMGSSKAGEGGIVVGMEGVAQTVLKANDRRYPYAFEGKTRAIIVRQMS